LSPSARDIQAGPISINVVILLRAEVVRIIKDGEGTNTQYHPVGACAAPKA
jgi:hypothetical protein